MSDHNSLRFDNPAYVRIRTYVGEGGSFAGLRPTTPEIPLADGLVARWKFREDVDSATLQLWITSDGSKKGFSTSELAAVADSVSAPPVPKGTECVLVHDYLLSDRNLRDALPYSDELLYDVFFKKVGELRILYSANPENEYLVNFLKHFGYLDLYYAKIERFYRKFKTEAYPQIRKTHSELIRICSEILDARRKQWKESDVKALSGWSLAIDELNFALRYDMESVESNLANLKSRIRTLGGENSRYFENHVEKAEFVLDAFGKAVDKNSLIKETILKNGIDYAVARREEEKLANEAAKIRHIKNIKELVSGLAFVEIFINGLAESVKIFELTGRTAAVLSGTAFLRASLILAFVVGYFAWHFVGKRFLQKASAK